MVKNPLPFLPAAWGAARNSAAALYDAGAQSWMNYAALKNQLAALAEPLKTQRKSLIFCLAESSLDGVIGYLAVAASGHAIAMIDPTLPSLGELLQQYQPEFIVAPSDFSPTGDYRLGDWPMSHTRLWILNGGDGHMIHPDLFLLLPTSGSTGGRKFVRLSYRNVMANTDAIIASLDLQASARAFLHLPLSYSFGLSVLHTQLATGGSVVVTGLGMMERGFWDLARQTEATLFPGVPYHFEMLARLGLARLNLPHLRLFLQAGGKLSPDLAASLTETITRGSGEFYIMYGQTEAAPRMSCFAAHRRPDKIGSAGTALPGGRFAIEEGEVIYSGPNVMMGYALTRADLAQGDIQGGVLRTGDLGTLDEEGFLTIAGRRQRFAKLYGVRIGLDEVEQLLRPIAKVAALEGEGKLVLATEIADAAIHAAMKACLQEKTAIQSSWLDIKTVAAFPLLPNGKLDYRTLMGQT